MPDGACDDDFEEHEVWFEDTSDTSMYERGVVGSDDNDIVRYVR
jgi:hypothetical protein